MIVLLTFLNNFRVQFAAVHALTSALPATLAFATNGSPRWWLLSFPTPITSYKCFSQILALRLLSFRTSDTGDGTQSLRFCF